jgi:hypothetical protein
MATPLKFRKFGDELVLKVGVGHFSWRSTPQTSGQIFWSKGITKVITPDCKGNAMVDALADRSNLR